MALLLSLLLSLLRKEHRYNRAEILSGLGQFGGEGIDGVGCKTVNYSVFLENILLRTSFVLSELHDEQWRRWRWQHGETSALEGRRFPMHAKYEGEN